MHEDFKHAVKRLRVAYDVCVSPPIWLKCPFNDPYNLVKYLSVFQWFQNDNYWLWFKQAINLTLQLEGTRDTILQIKLAKKRYYIEKRIKEKLDKKIVDCIREMFIWCRRRWVRNFLSV